MADWLFQVRLNQAGLNQAGLCRVVLCCSEDSSFPELYPRAGSSGLSPELLFLAKSQELEWSERFRGLSFPVLPFQVSGLRSPALDLLFLADPYPASEFPVSVSIRV